jgi:hypothetical protein
MSRVIARLSGLWAAIVICALFVPGIVFATELQSSNYRFDESVIGSGGLLQANSANFQATSATGDIAIGNAASTNYQVDSGTKTSPDPTLSFIINSAAANFPAFSPTSAAVATASFSVSNYTSYGYAVQISGTPPKKGAHTIPALATQTTSQAGTEQFGINLVANTSPSSVGANPAHGLFAVGSATSDYSTPNNYRFVSGDIIASAPSSSGVTTYTMTFLVNVAPLTEGGQYSSDQTIIVTGTY